jgi:ABC-2 type transport system ATP-binding protein
VLRDLISISPRLRAHMLGIVALLAVGLTACSSGGATNRATSTCRPPVTTVPTATPLPGSTTDWTVTSFDGTKIRVHWMPVATATSAKPAPTVLMGPGWGGAGDTDQTAPEDPLIGAITISDLHTAGYNVLTWDPRGFGESTGTVEIDSADHEGRDMSELIAWVASRPGVELDGTDDPRLGMVGGSYGGGIQFVTAAIDCRVDAIVPTIAWNSLGTSLYKADTFKIGWARTLILAAAGHHLDPHIGAAYDDGSSTGTLTADDVNWFLDRGPADLLTQVKVPTLIVQGTVDTLFTLQEGAVNYETLHHDDVTTSMIWYCSGHGVCLTDTGDKTIVPKATIAWLDRYVKRDASIDTGPVFRFVDQNGHYYSADRYPLTAGAPHQATGNGTLQLVATGGSGPATIPPEIANGMGDVIGDLTPAEATNAVDVPIDLGENASVIVGAPEVSLTYAGAPPTDTRRPTRVFAQLVDDSTGLVLGNQVTPIEVVLDGKSHTVTVPLELVAFTARPGAKLTLQLVATTVTYAPPALGGSIRFDKIAVSVPTATGLTDG